MKTNNIEIVTLNKKGITDFSSERNKILKASKSEWLFFIDSDEVVSKDLALEISNLDLQNSDYNGFAITRKNFFLRQYIGEDKIVRLGKIGSGKWVRMVHEVWDINGDIGQLKNSLIHNTAKNLHEYISKIDFYSGLHAKANKKEEKTATLFKIIFYPSLKFVQTLVLSKNVVFSIMQAFHSFLSWAKLYLSYYS